MKKKLLVLLCTALACTATACDNSKDETAKFEKEYGKVTLCDYKNLVADKVIYEVTDSSVSESIETMLYDYIETNEVTRASQEGDLLTLALTATKDGEVLLEYTDDDAYNTYIGYQDFGSEFDQKITGVSTGDELTFSITYDADFSYYDFADATIDFTVTILSVTEEILPELTDSFVTETLGYESKEALEKSVREQLESDNEYSSNYDLREDLIGQVIENSTFESYSQELYDKYAASIEANYQSYADMFGFETLEEIYEAFGITEETIEEEILNTVYRSIAVAAIAKAENITQTDEEYESNLTAFAEDYGYESTDELLADYDEDTLRSWFLEEEVLDFLQENATITEVNYSDVDVSDEE